MFKILVVDDESAIRAMLAEALALFDYEVETAANGVQALEKLKEGPFDMVLSDINMPRMGGFELLGRVADLHPRVKRVLMTASNLDEYMRMVLEHNVGNVIAKTVPLNFREMKEVLGGLLEEKVFGIERHMAGPSRILTWDLTEPDQIDLISAEIAGFHPPGPANHRFRVVLVELMTNALFYGARNERGDRKEDWVKDFRLAGSEAVKVTLGLDGEKIGVSVLDGGGKLDKHTVLYWLDRQTTPDESGLPKGVFDYHGRGFFITRKYVDRLVINIEKAKRCECCIFNFFENRYNGYKPLVINEL